MKRTRFKPKKTEWDIIREQRIKPRFEKAGITRCELNYSGCWRNNALSFAHAVKRRFLQTYAPEGLPTSIYTVILACTPCHDILEKMSHEEMKKAVMGIIMARKIQPVKVKKAEKLLEFFCGNFIE